MRMRLNELKRSYHTIISLGSNCLPAYHLRRCELRSFSGPLDWMISDSLDTVATLLENRFSGFMELENLRVEGIDADQKNFLVRDIRYNIVAAHHFPTQANQWHQLTTYPFFAEQLKRRIDRLYQIFAERIPYYLSGLTGRRQKQPGSQAFWSV
ncbi:DUF1796 family putative cysteine peptidase [Brevibacillus composti]|nr:DUF1796 family putative cysteine peptidase [Brevibacillus composti]